MSNSSEGFFEHKCVKQLERIRQLEANAIKKLSNAMAV